MKRRAAVQIAFAIFLGSTVPALADPSVDLSAGTLGAAASIRTPVSTTTALRLTYGTWQLGRSATFDNQIIDVSAHLRLSESFRVQTIGVYGERRLRAPLALVAGAVVNLNTISAVSVPADQSLTIGGVVYPEATAGTITTNVRWNRVAPYVGLALVPPPAARSAVFAEIGTFYQGKARVAFDATGAILANQATFQNYYDSERRQLTSELAPFVFFPVVQFGLRFRT